VTGLDRRARRGGCRRIRLACRGDAGLAINGAAVRSGVPLDRQADSCTAIVALAVTVRVGVVSVFMARIAAGRARLGALRLHAFRHTKGVELINNGMSLVHVQKWMAHMSPEMTLVYAKVLDTTLRKSWEQAVKNGLFKITSSGQLKQIDISGIENEDLIEWEYIRYNLDAVRMPLGFCMKPKKQDCFTQLNPCLTCRNLCTTPDFLPQYEHEIQETKLLIERGKAQGREVWVEKNQHLLERYEEIVSILRSGQTRHLAGKKGREYIGEERKNVN